MNPTTSQGLGSSQIDTSSFQPNTKPSRAAVALSHWYMAGQSPSPEDGPVQLHRVGAAFQALGTDVVFIHDQFQGLDPYERATLEDLRDLGVSVGDVVDYLRAAPGLNPHGKPVRADVATQLRKREFQSKSDRLESSGRSAAILAGSAALLAIGAIVVVPMALPALAPTAAPAITAALAPLVAWAAPLKAAATGLIQFAAGGGALAVSWKAWSGWQKIRSGSPRLDIGLDADFADLPASLGKLDYPSINDQYEAISGADRYLLAHLSTTEMRMFLSGSDGVRRHLLSANPPAPLAKIQSRLDRLARGRGVASTLRRAGAAFTVLITAPWHREAGNGRIPDLEKRLENWRANADLNRHLREDPVLEATFEPDHPDADKVIVFSPDRAGPVPSRRFRR